MGRDSLALSLSFLDLSDFPRHVVLKSEFSSNLVVLTILTGFPCICLHIFPLIYLVLDQSLLLSYIFPHLDRMILANINCANA